MHGERTFFGENWPNLVRNWLPMIDHPYDKATGEFIVTAPNHYQVVANGLLIEEIDLPEQHAAHALETVGADRIVALHDRGRAVLVAPSRASSTACRCRRGSSRRIARPGSALFEDLSRRAMQFFIAQHRPVSRTKSSPTCRPPGFSGGTEYASAIFYGEKGVSSGRGPVVHEIAHQWFGDSVTERDWDDVWLSEGFATYFALLFTEHDEGRDAFVDGLKRSRAQVLQLEQKLPDTPVIHRNLADMNKVLNNLVYQKGGWVLHMLRQEVGTEHFWTAIREYYRRYRNGNASTADLRAVFEQVSGKQLDWFFTQWLNRAGRAEDRRLVALRRGEESGRGHARPVASPPSRTASTSMSASSRKPATCRRVEDHRAARPGKALSHFRSRPHPFQWCSTRIRRC